MKTVVITSQKGGSGKQQSPDTSQLPSNAPDTAPWLLIDTDPQQTLATWWKVREAEVPKLAPVILHELPEKLEAADGLFLTASSTLPRP